MKQQKILGRWSMGTKKPDRPLETPSDYDN
jgi:hypothetical protein